MRGKDYHSALHPVAREYPARQSFQGRHGVAFVWDLANGLPPSMRRGGKVDVLYAEPPWRDGYKKFAERAGVNVGMEYRAFMTQLGEEVRLADRPAVVIAGRHAVKALNPDHTVQCTLNGYRHAVACTWGGVYLPPGLDTIKILETLARTYDVVGDPCCGYGRAGKVFARAGKRYVMSDFNPTCIGYIEAHEQDWP